MDEIKRTDDDAAISRLSAASLGYFQDQFAKKFVKKSEKRPPLINRGTFVRISFLKQTIQRFLLQNNSRECQVVSFGAGSDTKYFSMKYEDCFGDYDNNNRLAKYFEVDFPEITSKKCMKIGRDKDLKPLLSNIKVESGGIELDSDQYCLLSGDLRNFDEVSKKLYAHGFSSDLPTLFMSECVLIYMPQEYSDVIVDWTSKNCKSCIFVTFEQILPNDKFGQVMLNNLSVRGIDLPGIHAYPTLESQKERYLKAGYTTSHAIDMSDLYKLHVSNATKHRLDRIERLDEVEEWDLLAKHYCISWGCQNMEFPRFGPV